MRSQQNSTLIVILILSCGLTAWNDACWAKPNDDKELLAQPEETTNEPKPLGSESQLSEQDVEDLLGMYEEERLAHDVYMKLREKWSLPMFDNISSAESVHIATLANLIRNYDVDLSLYEKAEGNYANSEIQSLYGDLVARGQKSLEDAIKVGLLIEEMDIADLKARIERTKKPDIREAYQFLQRGSRNHLRAFYRQAMSRKVEYVPQHLSATECDEIVQGAHERGRIGFGRRRM